jgi:hypothetical protein
MNKNRALCYIIILSIICTITFVMSASKIAEGSNSNLIIHGGGSGKITCADGSHPQANVAFIIRSVNGSTKGNWTLDDFNESAKQGTFFTEGTIYNGNASLNQYSVIGNSDNINEEIKLCNPQLQTPISITGSCGQNAAISVQLESKDRPKIADNFNGDVTCGVQ